MLCVNKQILAFFASYTTANLLKRVAALRNSMFKV